MRWIIILLLWLLLGFGYYSISKMCCGPGGDEVSNVSATAPVVNDSKEVPCPSLGELSFKWSEVNPTLSDSWKQKMESLTKSLEENQKLQITGIYREGETQPDNSADLGIARAQAISKLFDLPEDKLQLRSRKIPKGDYSQDCAITGVDFRNVIVTEKIKEIDDKTIIYFPFNSTNKLNDNEVEAYLRDVAERVKKTGERIRLTGHTDDVGEEADNIVLGQGRADVIQSYLMSQGVPKAKIISTSKGEGQPIASNDTEDGKQRNRRTELQIIK